MTTPDHTREDRHADAVRTLKMLDAVERGDAKSQRALARDMEVALGFANAYVRRCIRKGWIKVREAPARRYFYYVTPAGFLEKARLTAEYLSSSFQIFRACRGQCDDLMAQCTRNGYTRVALVGASDLAEIAVLSALDGDVKVVAVVDLASNQQRLAGIPIVRSLAEAGALDAVIVTDIRTPQQTYEQLASTMADARIFAPAMLHVVRDRRATPFDTDEAAE